MTDGNETIPIGCEMYCQIAMRSVKLYFNEKVSCLKEYSCG